jgi:hypothetical protein
MGLSVAYSGNKTHDAAVMAAELARQVATAYGTSISQATLNSAWINYHRSVVASAKANNLPCEPSLRPCGAWT